MSKKKCKKCRWWIAPMWGKAMGECNSVKHWKNAIPNDLIDTVCTIYTGRNHRCEDWEAKE